jgi:hypothetical protein
MKPLSGQKRISQGLVLDQLGSIASTLDQSVVHVLYNYVI